MDKLIEQAHKIDQAMREDAPVRSGRGSAAARDPNAMDIDATRFILFASRKPHPSV